MYVFSYNYEQITMVSVSCVISLSRLTWKILTFLSSHYSPELLIWSTFCILDRCCTSHHNAGTMFAHWMSAFPLAFGGNEHDIDKSNFSM